MSNAENMDCFQVMINLIDYAIVAITQAVTSLLVSLEGFAAERGGLQRVYGRNNVPANIAMCTMEPL